MINAEGTAKIIISACEIVSSKLEDRFNLFKSKLTELKYFGLCLYCLTKSISPWFLKYQLIISLLLQSLIQLHDATPIFTLTLIRMNHNENINYNGRSEQQSSISLDSIIQPLVKYY